MVLGSTTLTVKAPVLKLASANGPTMQYAEVFTGSRTIEKNYYQYMRIYNQSASKTYQNLQYTVSFSKNGIVSAKDFNNNGAHCVQIIGVSSGSTLVTITYNGQVSMSFTATVP